MGSNFLKRNFTFPSTPVPGILFIISMIFLNEYLLRTGAFRKPEDVFINQSTKASYDQEFFLFNRFLCFNIAPVHFQFVANVLLFFVWKCTALDHF